MTKVKKISKDLEIMRADELIGLSFELESLDLKYKNPLIIDSPPDSDIDISTEE